METQIIKMTDKKWGGYPLKVGKDEIYIRQSTWNGLSTILIHVLLLITILATISTFLAIGIRQLRVGQSPTYHNACCAIAIGFFVCSGVLTNIVYSNAFFAYVGWIFDGKLILVIRGITAGIFIMSIKSLRIFLMMREQLQEDQDDFYDVD